MGRIHALSAEAGVGRIHVLSAESGIGRMPTSSGPLVGHPYVRLYAVNINCNCIAALREYL